ncbi:hypothetical protein OQA88_4299 [Cercophora sp. LCS_1]
MKLTTVALALVGVDLVAGAKSKTRWRPKKKFIASTICPLDTDFRSVSAGQWITAGNPGWNVGNTLDALPTEGSWNNPPLQESTLDHVKAAGYKSVRIPVTYHEHYVAGSPDWRINSTWLQRVSDVVDMATKRDLYVITNMHHDSWNWADVSKPGANQTEIREKFYASWFQIATVLACKPASVAFEPINEPPGNTAEDAENLNALNDLFLEALADAGGYNKQRVVTLSSLGMGSDKMHFFRRPTNVTNPWAFQFHFYSPYDFIFGAWGKTTWGSPADLLAVTTELTSVRANFSDVPILLGEFSASQLNTEPAARWKWYDHVLRVCKQLGIGTVLWDNGLDNLQRETGIWRDPTSVEIAMAVLRGESNSLPESTTDPEAKTQESSAYVWNKLGENVTEKRVEFLLNGNAVVGVEYEGRNLTGVEYGVQGGAVILRQEFLKGIFDGDKVGSLANLTVRFSQGVNLGVELVQWDVPTIGLYESRARDVRGGEDLHLPVVWKGLHRVAAVKIVKADGGFLVDDWTQWLPELQKGRGTYSNHWSFDHNRITIAKGAVEAVIAAGQNVTFTFEFFPRAEGNGNSFNYTLTV